MGRGVLLFSAALAACTPSGEARGSHSRAPLLDVGPLGSPRAKVSATLLPTGEVLFAGGTTTTDGLALAELFDPQTGASSALPPLPSPHFFHTATVLRSGAVLVVAGKDTFTSSSGEVASFDPLTRTWSSELPVAPRERHTCTALEDGRMLVTGSRSGVLGGLLRELDGGWMPTGPMLLNRGEHTATRLADGRVLVVGGYHDPLTLVTESAELFDPATGSWADAGAIPAEARYGHAAVRLADGRVLVAGGSGPLRSSGALATAVIHQPLDGGWSVAPSMNQPRTGVSGALLPDGRVLIYGSGSAQSPGELFDPEDGGWTLLAMSSAGFRQEQGSTILPSGEVLFVGGSNGGGLSSVVEIYDPSRPSWRDVGGLPSPRTHHTLTTLSSGQVLLAGGTSTLDTALLFEPATNGWSTTGALRVGRESHTATLLRSGQVLLAGGAGPGGAALQASELFDAATKAFVSTGPLASARVGHRATLLPSGKVLVTGGRASLGGAPVATAELYDPQLGTWAPTGNAMTAARAEHFATLLQDGRVLLVGELTDADLYDPSSDRFTAAPNTTAAHAGPFGALLPNGKVVLAGGVAALEEFDPDGGWSSVGLSTVSRRAASATLMPGGKVLFAGGLEDGGPSAVVELYDPRTRAVTAASPRNAPQDQVSARLLDGRALFAGGAVPGAEAFDDGLTPIAALRPVLTGPLPETQPGALLHLTGSGFLRPGSHGSFSEGEASFPLLRLERLDNLDARYAPTREWTATSAVAVVPATIQPGWHLARVIVNGATSEGVPLLIAFPLPDAGVPDAGTADAGMADAGVADGGSSDGGTVDPDSKQLLVGCGCHSVEPGALLSLALLLTRLMARRRHIARPSRPRAPRTPVRRCPGSPTSSPPRSARG